VTRQHVLQAIAEYDDRGRDAFVGVYGFQPSALETLVHEGRTYDAAAVVGVAHRYATGRVATADDLRGREDAVASVLVKGGFEVKGALAEPEPRAKARPAASKPRAARAAAPRATTTRSTTEERPPAICPTCFTQLPATGVCDNCA